MHIFQFIKYNQDTTLAHLKKNVESGAVLCFDFEDSIHNWIDPQRNAELKQRYRNYFKKIHDNFFPELDKIKIGIRINNEQKEIEKDIAIISNLHIHYIIIPKVETLEQLKYIKQILIKANVEYDELLPLIESKKGIANLHGILKEFKGEIQKIGFGHCDYNLSIKSFPFFHQSSLEYWKWMKNIYSICAPFDISLINSAYLELENTIFFSSMLTYLQELYKEKTGQFTLTSNQSRICKTYSKNPNPYSFSKLIENRLDLKVPIDYSEKIINAFEDENEEKGFTILKKKGQLISPQEYVAAKNYLKNKKSKEFNFTFVGGCLAVQHNILFEDLFHQLLKEKIENSYNVELNIKIIRYERFKKCFDKIVDHNNTHPIDFLIFHIRPEPFLRLVKFYYKYKNSKGKVKHSFNIPALKLLNPEKYDLLILGRRFGFGDDKKNNKIYRLLIDLNYRIGILLGNKKYALKKYFELIDDVINYCHQQKIMAIILGPAFRAGTKYEPYLSRQLNTYFSDVLAEKNIRFIDIIDVSSNMDCPLFHSNGIHVTTHYHKLISEKIFCEIRKEMEKISNQPFFELIELKQNSISN